MTVRESEWDAEQADIMIALGRYRAMACSGCGGHLPDTTAGDDQDVWDADLPIRCHRCTAIAVRRDQYRDTPQPQALLYTAHRRAGHG